MKKDVTINIHLDNLVEITDIIRTELEDTKTYYLYPTFWYYNDCDRAYLTICITKELGSFGNSLTIFPPDVELQVDLYIQLGRIMELVKASLSIFTIQAIQYKEA